MTRYVVVGSVVRIPGPIDGRLGCHQPTRLHHPAISGAPQVPGRLAGGS